MDQYAVLFDMDGTISHTNPFHAQAFERFLDRHNIPYTQQEFEEHMYGKHNSYIMSYFFKRNIAGEELKQLEDEKESLFREIYRDKVDSLPGFIPFLDDLRAKGFKTAVATAAPSANLQLIVERLHIQNKMDALLVSEDVVLHKPHPDVYLQSATRLGVVPEACVVFEDSFSGITAGLNAGMKVVGVLSSHKREELPSCSLYIKDYREVNASLIRDLLKGN